MKLAFVIPWFGRDIPGGAEAECRSTAIELLRAGFQVEILTTCIREFHSDWNVNHHRPGIEDWDGLVIRRFKANARDSQAFDRINLRLMRGHSVSEEQQAAFMRENVWSDGLLDYMKAHRDEYVFIHIPYMFGTTYFGILACPDRSVIIPCLHDESYAHMPVFREMFEKVRGIIYNTRAERALTERLFKPRPDAGRLIGIGIDTDLEADGTRFKAKHGLGRYLLYAGRQDEGKNTPLLLNFFTRYKDLFPSDLKLVLIGAGNLPIPRRDDVLRLGFVPKQEKLDAYAGAVALCQPSLNESFSIVMTEAWLAGTPVLVHEGCEVTRDHCVASNGGLYFKSFSDFVGCVDYFLGNPEEARRMGRNGEDYTRANYAWQPIVQKYRDALKAWGFTP